jgi:transcriptional regulator with XRE-family HTH domain
MMNTVASRIKDVLRVRGWGRAELARRSGIAESTIQRYMSGYTPTIPSDKLTCVADALGVPASFILGSGPFERWYDIKSNLPSFITALASGQEEVLRTIWDVDADNLADLNLVDLISCIDFYAAAVSYENGAWSVVRKDLTPVSGTVLTAEKRELYALIDSLSDDEVSRLLQIARLVQGG